MIYKPKTGASVEIYLGPGQRLGEPEYERTLGKIWEIHNEMNISKGFLTGQNCIDRHGCDLIMGQLFDDDPRLEEFARRINTEIDRVFAEVVPYNPETDERLKPRQ